MPSRPSKPRDFGYEAPVRGGARRLSPGEALCAAFSQNTTRASSDSRAGFGVGFRRVLSSRGERSLFSHRLLALARLLAVPLSVRPWGLCVR